jgi:hypothetical protein
VKSTGFFSAFGKRSVEDINRNFLLGKRDLLGTWSDASQL